MHFSPCGVPIAPGWKSLRTSGVHGLRGCPERPVQILEVSPPGYGVQSFPGVVLRYMLSWICASLVGCGFSVSFWLLFSGKRSLIVTAVHYNPNDCFVRKIVSSCHCIVVLGNGVVPPEYFCNVTLYKRIFIGFYQDPVCLLAAVGADLSFWTNYLPGFDQEIGIPNF